LPEYRCSAGLAVCVADVKYSLIFTIREWQFAVKAPHESNPVTVINSKQFFNLGVKAVIANIHVGSCGEQDHPQAASTTLLVVRTALRHQPRLAVRLQ